MQAQLRQVFGHVEQGHGLQRRRDRVTRFYAAGEHHAVRRRPDGGFRQVDLVGGQRRFSFIDAGAGAGLIGDSPFQHRSTTVQFGFRRHFAARQPRHFFEPRQTGLGFFHCGDGLRDFCGSRRQRCPRTQNLVTQLGGVEFNQHLAFFDGIIHVNMNLQHGAGEFAADVHRAGRLQRAVGSDRQGQIATHYRLGGVDRRGVGGLAILPNPQASGGERQQQHADPQRGAAIPN